MVDLRPVFLIVGLLLMALAAAMALPALVDAAWGNPDWHVFVISAAVTGGVGGTLVLACRGIRLELGLRQAFVLTTASWATLAAFAALPFVFSHLAASYTDAFFESMSGLTTTGSTILTGLDTMPPGILLWRALLQWVGGIGIIVMGMAVLPFLRVGGMQLFRTESSDRSEKILPRPGQIAAAIGLVYVVLTVLCAAGYAAFGMTGFEAVAHAFTTVATGGYSTSDGSIGHFASPGIEWTAVLFMLGGSLPFVLYVRTLQGRYGAMWRDAQVRTLLAFLAVAVAAATAYLWASGRAGPEDALRLAAFNVVSVVTTTGYASADYAQWGGFAVVGFLVLMFVGGCTGSTAGAIKAFRFVVVLALLRRQVRRLWQPHAVVPLTYQRREVPDEVVASVVAFFTLYSAALVALTLCLGALGLDIVTSLSGAATALGNVGPGLGAQIGPAGTFAALPDAAKWLLSGGMLLGRLELFTVLVLLVPAFWRA